MCRCVPSHFSRNRVPLEALPGFCNHPDGADRPPGPSPMSSSRPKMMHWLRCQMRLCHRIQNKRSSASACLSKTTMTAHHPWQLHMAASYWHSTPGHSQLSVLLRNEWPCMELQVTRYRSSSPEALLPIPRRSAVSALELHGEQITTAQFAKVQKLLHS